MSKPLPPETIYDFIVNDFEDAWNSVSSNQSARGRGNFMFSLIAMILLEFASRLCFSDKSGNALGDLSKELFRIEPRYSTQLPGLCAEFKEFDLPYDKSKGEELLWALFDLIRNGQAHQYQQIVVRLKDKINFKISLSGADVGQHLKILSASRPADHLGYKRNSQKDLWVIVHPGILFLDIKNAITTSGLLKKGLTFEYLRRPKVLPRKTNRFYQFDSGGLENNLALGGHRKI